MGATAPRAVQRGKRIGLGPQATVAIDAMNFRKAVYVGDLYLVLNGTEHIRALAARFDDLIRHAVAQPPDVVKWLGGLSRELASSRRRAKSKSGMKHGAR